MSAWYQLSTDEAVSQLQSSFTGLASSNIGKLQSQYGKNLLKEAKRKSKLAIIAGQFKDIMIIILIIAAIISFFAGERTDAFVILAIILGNAFMGYSQESNAEESMKMLQKMSAQFAMVLRDNNPTEVETSELVPGDIILLEAGDIVPADARLIEISSFKTEEAALTGESNTIEKNTEPIREENLMPGDQHNMVFKGTIVSNGTAKAIVIATGMETEIGKIAGMMEVAENKTPLQKRLNKFSKQLAFIVIIICVIVFSFGLWRGEPPLLMFLTALSLAVAALPEALPAVITIALASGARRMADQKALVRNLPAVETLGSVTYICTDKTGTLTQNIMSVEKLEASKDQEELFYHAMILNNDVRIDEDGKIMGDSTEVALIQYALDQGLTLDKAEQTYPLHQKIPFDSDRMRMSTLHTSGNGFILFTKGAPVKVIEVLSSKYKAQSEQWLELNRTWASEGLRVLFFGFKKLHSLPGKIDPSVETDIEFLGIAAMMDPPREEVIDAIRECHSAGIRTVMITGDQPLTANAIASRLEIRGEGAAETLTGADLQKLSEKDFTDQIRNISVYARVSPEQKLNIVKALQESGEFVAMTGDGVNDAPSLKQADIGVAMGITGTDVSKEAADVILLDDHFATIVKAVKGGRRIYDNIKKFILYVLSCNLAEILVIFFAPVLGLAIPLLPIHILWINLVTDGLPGLALTLERAEKDIMQRPPRNPNESLFAGGMVSKILTRGTIMAIAAIIAQSWARAEGLDVRTQQTIVFSLLCFVQLGNALSVRSLYHPVFVRMFSNWRLWGAIGVTILMQILIIYVPALHPVFKTTSLDLTIIALLFAGTILTVFFIEILKHITRNRYKRSLHMPDKAIKDKE